MPNGEIKPFVAWARRHAGWLVAVAMGAATVIGVVTGSRIEWGGDRLTRHETRLEDLDARLRALESVFTREIRLLIAAQCNTPGITNEMFDLLDCRTRLDRVGVDNPRRRP